MRSLSIALTIFAILALWSGALLAQHAPAGEARARARKAWQQADQADRTLRFREALLDYQAVSQLDPSSPFAPLAHSRSQWLQQRSEGEFVPLTSTERVRRDPAAMHDPKRIRALYEASLTFPPGLVRVEAWLVVADASIRFLDRADDAQQAWSRVVQDAHADRTQKAIALEGLVELSLARGQVGAAASWVNSWGDVAPKLRAKVYRLQRTRRIVRASVAVLAAVVALGAGAAVRVWRRRGLRSLRLLVPWWAPLFGAYLALGGAALAYAYERAAVVPFAVLGAGTAVLLCVARAWSLALPAGGWRFVAAGLAALAVAALSVLALQTNPSLAEGFGL